MRIQHVIIGISLVLALGGGLWLLKAGKPSAPVAPGTAGALAHEAKHREIDVLVAEMTAKYGYTNEAAGAIVAKLNEPGSGVHAQLNSSGDIEINIPGARMARKILMNKPDLGNGK